MNATRSNDEPDEAHFRAAHAMIGAALRPRPHYPPDLRQPYLLSREALGKYTTLDFAHYRAIVAKRKLIEAYYQDLSRTHPLNIVLVAAPGSGKSHFVRSLTEKMPELEDNYVDLNMATISTIHDFVQPLEEVRNLKAEDKLPLLFLDEFDAHKTSYALLLPLLWDGALDIDGRTLKLGRVVIVLAASGQEVIKSIETAIPTPRPKPTRVSEDSKLPDLLSRVNGGRIQIPDLDPSGSHARAMANATADKVCIAIALLHRRFKSKPSSLPRRLLAFIGTTRFTYSVRSLAHLVESIDPIPKDATTLDPAKLAYLGDPAEVLERGLAAHILPPPKPKPLDKHAARISRAWESFCDIQGQVTVPNSDELKGRVDLKSLLSIASQAA